MMGKMKRLKKRTKMKLEESVTSMQRDPLNAERTFNRYANDSQFRRIYHPENAAIRLAKLRRVASVQRLQFLRELAAGSLLLPRLKRKTQQKPNEQEVEKDATAKELDAIKPTTLALRPAHKLRAALRVEPLLSSVVEASSAVLWSALCQNAPSASESRNQVQAAYVADPLPSASQSGAGARVRVVAGFSSRDAASASAVTLRSLPHLRELIQSVSVEYDGPVPPPLRDPLPPQPPALALRSQCEALVEALSKRLSLPSLRETLNDDFPSLEVSDDERLWLYLTYLRRVLCFDLQRASQRESPLDLIENAGETCLVAVPLAEMDTRGSVSAISARIEAHINYLQNLADADARASVDMLQAAEKFYDSNCERIDDGKFRCPLSGKLFKDPVYVRKHIDNKHAHLLSRARAVPLEEKLRRYFLAAEARVSALSEIAAAKPIVGGGSNGEISGSKRKRAQGNKFNAGRGRGRGRAEERRGLGKGGGPPPPPPDARLIHRPLANYHDLDAPDVDALFS